MRQYKALISLVCLGFGLAVIGQSVFIPFEPVPAKVTESNLTALPRSSDRPPRYRSSFTYEYIYRDRQYTSKQYAYFGRNRGEAVCRYNVGDTLTAYVNQHQPSFAVINRHPSVFAYALAILGSLMLVHTLLDYVPALANQRWFQKIYARLGALIGITVFFGGLAYFGYYLVLATHC
ncbi:MAG: DUF3592 domain-containing protein [Leptolyngbya sp. SIOISBB]|nr:DUF3592 domain-containing protein [Leptolyngbya sp. SIOISBB]